METKIIGNSTVAIITEQTQSVWALINRILFYIPPAVLIYLLFILLFNSSRGFDITDDSFYLLWADQPENVLASTTQFGYYTRMLYVLSGKNIANFRILGILMLLGAAGLFSFSLERYWTIANGRVFVLQTQCHVIPPILIGALAYYGFWLITPSYNWLALLSILITGTGLLCLATNYQQKGMLIASQINSILYGLIVGIGGGLAFMAKPTSAAALVVVTFFWIAAHPIRGIQLKLFVGTAFCTSCIFLFVHVAVFEGSVDSFYLKVRNGMETVNLLGAGHTIGNLIWQNATDLKHIPGKVFRITPAGFLLFPIFWWIVWLMNRRRHEANAKFVLSLFLIGFNLYIWYRLWDMGLWSFTSIGFGGIAFSFSLILSALLTLYALKKGPPKSSQFPFKRLMILCIFLFMLAVSQAFGTANGLVRQMSLAYVFFASAVTYIAFWIDQYIDRKVLCNMIPVLVSVSVVIVMMLAFKHPYRLPGKISKQVVESSFLMGGGPLKVDVPTAEYIDVLKRIAQKAGWEPGTPLIDLTGGSPGATVILGGRIAGYPWLPGSYKGSNEFAETILKMTSKSLQNDAWVLTAPVGKRRLSSHILLKIGLNFPKSYVAIGNVRSGHRNEEQVLWRPLNTISIEN